MSLHLEPTGEAVTTITSSPELARDDRGELWFVKDDQVQGLQLKFLRRLDLPVPELEFLDDGRIATRKVGIALSDEIGEHCDDPDYSAQLLEDAGLLLGRVHERLRFYDGVEPSESWMFSKPSTTAHPVENFFYRFIQGASSSTNAMHEPLPETGIQIRNKVIELVGILTEGVADQDLFDALATRLEVTYGDYKTPNIVYSQSTGELFLIDPMIHRGNRTSDLGKFCTRAVLEPDTISLGSLDNFVNGYRKGAPMSQIDTRMLCWLMAFDAANILSSYLGRMGQKDLSFHIVKRLAYDKDYVHTIYDFLDYICNSLDINAAKSENSDEI